MTTLIHAAAPAGDGDARPDVRTDAHSHRHSKRRRKAPSVGWLLFGLLWFAIGVGGLFVVAVTLGAAAYAATPTA